MILRRIADAFRKQDWFTVFVETMIVVLGVFLGLQVNNWNEARAERRNEAAYLLRLHVDVEAAEATTMRLAERVAKRVADADRASEAIYGRDANVTELDADACDSISRLHIFYLEGYALPTLEELVASGRFNVISDEQLLKALSDYHSFARSAPFRAESISAQAPILPQEFPGAIVLWSAFEDGERVRDTECDLAAMRSDPAFINAFTEVRSRAGFFVNNLLARESALIEGVHRELDRVIAADHKAEARQ